MRAVCALVLAILSATATAETVPVKYHRPVSLEAFACTQVNEASDVKRVCYDAAERYMLIRLRDTWYHYCTIDAATVKSLLSASSKRQFYESRIRGTGSDGPFDCRTHPIPAKYQR